MKILRERLQQGEGIDPTGVQTKPYTHIERERDPYTHIYIYIEREREAAAQLADMVAQREKGLTRQVCKQFPLRVKTRGKPARVPFVF